MQELVPVLQVVHGAFNGALLVAFLLQGTLGWRIRRRRLAGTPPDFAVVRKHRRRGPVLAALLPATYLLGLLTAYLHRGRLVTAPAHLAGGTTLLLCCAAVVVLSRRIRGPQSPPRTWHFAAGVATLAVFVTQVFLGLDILL
jgi:hypothetical protein